MRAVLFALLFIPTVALLMSCGADKNKNVEKFLNTDEIPGLGELGDHYSNVKLHYQLDTADNGVKQFSSCTEVDNASEEEIKPDQYPLLRMLQINCEAIRRFLLAPDHARTAFPETLTTEWVQGLPATAVPDLGGNKEETPDKTLAQRYKDFSATLINPHNVEAQFDDLDINYVVLARGDFNDDGMEEMLLRLDWDVVSAYGNGFTLVLVSTDGEGLRATPLH